METALQHQHQHRTETGDRRSPNSLCLQRSFEQFCRLEVFTLPMYKLYKLPAGINKSQPKTNLILSQPSHEAVIPSLSDKISLSRPHIQLLM